MIPNYLHKPSGYKTRNPMFWWYWYNTLRKNCVLYLPMVYNNAAHTQVKDWSGNGNHGTITGATKITAPFNQALYFDGVDDYVDLDAGNETNITGYNISIESWVKFLGWHIYNTGFIDHNWGNSNSYQIYQMGTAEDTGLLAFAGPGAGMEMGTRLSLDSWHHIVFVQNSTDKIIYLDGVQDAINSNPGEMLGNDNPLVIGAGFNSGDRMNMTMGEVRIYKVALTVAQILKIYNWTKSAYGH